MKTLFGLETRVHAAIGLVAQHNEATKNVLLATFDTMGFSVCLGHDDVRSYTILIVNHLRGKSAHKQWIQVLWELIPWLCSNCKCL